MPSHFQLYSLLLFCLVSPTYVNVSAEDQNVPFQKSYAFLWGEQNIKLLNKSLEVQLSADEHSGGAGFQSLGYYGSGWFSMMIKLPQKDSTGIITTFYLMSEDGGTRDEIDFEFLGCNKKEHPACILLSTNIFTNGQGNREYQVFLWFDPTVDFHNYTLLWNEKQIVFYVDDTPIRVFKNTTNKGGSYPTKALKVFGTIWNGTWAGTPNWNDAPFEAHFRGFSINACRVQNTPGQECHSSMFWWNGNNYWTLLNPTQKQAYKNVRKKYLRYDYCAKKNKSPECQN